MRIKKKAQVTIFIILALILVISVATIYVIRQGPQVSVPDVDEPQKYIEHCAKEAMEESILILSQQAGDLEVEGGADYKGRKIPYLCYNANYYFPCINQRPMLIEHIKKQVNDYVELRVENCFKVVKKSLEGKYNIEMGEMDFNLEFYPRQVVVEINRDFKMTRGEEVRSFNTFKAGIINPIFSLAEVAMEIVNQQSSMCYFSEQGFMVFYPQYDIRKYWMPNETRIYNVEDIPTKQNFIFAVRSCAMPIGFP